MWQSTASVILDPQNPARWPHQPFEALFQLPREEVEAAQVEAIGHRFETLRPVVGALDKLATKQGVERIETLYDVLPVLFDHRVYKSYPLSLIEQRRFDALTTWLQRLTTVDLSSMSLEGLSNVDDWLTRLDDHGMIMSHSSGTTGKLSLIPRSTVEWPAWKRAFFNTQVAATGIDFEHEQVTTISAMYRTGHQALVKMSHIFAEASAGGEDARVVLYDHAISSDLLSLAGRLQGAKERGEDMEFDPALLAGFEELIARGRDRDVDLQTWFARCADEFHRQKVIIRGTSADLVRIAMAGTAQGISCEFAPGSAVMAGGGMKGFTDAPADWRSLVMAFFGVSRLSSTYGMSEIMGHSVKCSEDHFHYPPYTVTILLDAEAGPLPAERVQTGRLAVFDLLAETSWGGFVSGDRITMHFDEPCGCGRGGAWIEDDIQRFAHMEGGDDKITCAGTTSAYNEFMDFVSGI